MLKLMVAADRQSRYMRAKERLIQIKRRPEIRRILARRPSEASTVHYPEVQEEPVLPAPPKRRRLCVKTPSAAWQ